MQCYDMKRLLRSTEGVAHIVLESTGACALHDTLVDDSKAQFMAVCGRAVACETDDTRQCTRFGTHVVVGESALHPVLQCPVRACYGQRWQ